jgi:putative oxidoreductase
MFIEKSDEFSERWAPYAVALLRIVTSLLFIEHGTAKLFGWPEVANMPAPQEWSLPWIGGWMEVIFGTMLLIGLLTRPVAFLLAGEMAVAYWLYHAPQGFFPLQNMGEGAILYCFIFLMFVATGPGNWSVDQIIARNRSDVWGYAAPGGERPGPDE